jgi:UDP-N-acetylglucosamine 2-epimerase (non-hydrolysing)
MLKRFDIICKNTKFVKPLDYFSFLQLEKNARLILTDSGGVQEEACIMNVPCVTLRDNTERVETIEIGANIIAGVIRQKISQSVEIMLRKKRNWNNPFGDGKASTKIMEILTGFLTFSDKKLIYIRSARRLLVLYFMQFRA